MTHRTPWSDFAQALKSMEELKEELHKTDMKLQNASMTNGKQQHERRDNVTSPDPMASAVHDKYLEERRWRKRKIYSRLKGSHLNTNFQFEDLMPCPNVNGATSSFSREDEPRLFHRQPLNKNRIHDAAKYTSSNLGLNFNTAFSKEPGEIWESGNPAKTKSSELISTESQSDRSQTERPSQIRFSKWEKEYLQKEVPDIQISDTNCNSRDNSETFVKLPMSKPVLTFPENTRTKKLALQVERLQNCDGFKKLKEIIELQRERNNRILFEAENDSFLNESISNNGKNDAAINVPISDRHDLPADSAVSAASKSFPKIGPTVVRKTAVAQPPSIYKGFSSIKDAFSTSPMKTINSKISSPNKEKVVSKSWKLKNKPSVPPCIILNDPISCPLHTNVGENKLPEDVAAEEDAEAPKIEPCPENSAKNTNPPPDVFVGAEVDEECEERDVASSPRRNATEDKENDLPSPDQHLIKVQNILKQIMDDHENISGSAEYQSEQSAMRTEFPATKKRKATRPPEQIQPAAKVRHYNQEAVREYILKKKATRKKMEKEERQMKLKAEQEIKERLQQLFDYQKSSAKSVQKVKPPLKIVQENYILEKTTNARPRDSTPVPSPRKTCSCNKVPRNDKELILPAKSKPLQESKTDNVEEVDTHIRSNTELSLDRTQSHDMGMSSQKVMDQDTVDSEVIDCSPKVEKIINIKEPFDQRSVVEDLAFTESHVVEDNTKSSTSSVEQMGECSQSTSVSEMKHEDHDQSRTSSRSSRLSLQEILPKAIGDIKKRLFINSVPNAACKNTNPQDYPSMDTDVNADKPGTSTHQFTEKNDEPSFEEGPLDSLTEDQLYETATSNERIEISNVIPSQKIFFNVGHEEPLVIDPRATQDVLIEGPLESLLDSKEKQVPAPDATKVKRFLKWDFDKLSQSTPNPYNFINTFQRKPLVMNQPVTIEEEQKNDTMPSSIHMVEANVMNSYSSNFSTGDAHSSTTEVSEESKKLTKVSRERADPPVAEPEEVLSIISNGESTTISSMISTDTEEPIMAEENCVDSSSSFLQQNSEAEEILTGVEATTSNNSNHSKDRTLTESVIDEKTISGSTDVRIEKTLTESNQLNSQSSQKTINYEEEIVQEEVVSSEKDDDVTKSSSSIKTNSNVETLTKEKEVSSEVITATSVNHGAIKDDQSIVSTELDVNAQGNDSKTISSFFPSNEADVNVISTKSTEKSIKSMSEVNSCASLVNAASSDRVSSSENVVLRETVSKPVTRAANNNHLQTYSVVHPMVEPLIDSRSVTRVVAEAASAAATSAVIAALEYQKLLPTKKQLLEVMERRGFSSSNRDYSSDFESSKESFSASSLQPSSIVRSIEASAQSEQSIDEEMQAIESSAFTLSRTVRNNTAVSIVSSIPGASLQESENQKSGQSVSTVPEDFVVKVAKTRKQSENASSPSPASLSDNESLRSTSINTTASSASHTSGLSNNVGKLLNKDPFDQLTLDMVKQRSLEDERRARQQLTLLECQERALLENARSELKWLELLKKKLKEKKANDKLPVVVKRQEEILLRLRQERAQLHCLKETYRNVSHSRHGLQAEKKKLLTGIDDPDCQLFSKRSSLTIPTQKVSGKASPTLSLSAASDISVATANQSTIDETKSPGEDIPEAVLSFSSSAESMVESQIASASKVSSSSFGKHSKSQSVPSRSTKADSLVPQTLSQASHSLESVMQGMKRLEANKRYLTKKEQRLLQRRNRVESLIHWQRKLSQEEKDVKQLEKRAIEIMEKSKLSSKHYVSSSSPSSPKHDVDISDVLSARPSLSSSKEIPSIVTAKASTSNEGSVSGSSAVEDAVIAVGEPESSDNIPEASSISTAKGSRCGSSAEDKAGSAVSEELILNLSGSSGPAEDLNGSNQSFVSEKSSLNDTLYSDSFVSSASTTNELSNAQKSSNSPAQKKRIKAAARAGFLSGRHRRQDSSGSDDSLTISQSETASDQSDIEGRIYALTEELKRRKNEADKLRGEQKKQRCDQLKEKESSLKKQLEAYDKFIKDTRLELEQQLEAINYPDATSPTPVKPQIKQPRVAKSRHLQKQPSIVQVLSPEKENIAEIEISDLPITKDISLFSNERIQQSTSHLAKKLRAIETKEVSDEASAQLSSTSSLSRKAISVEAELSSNSNILTEKNTDSEKDSAPPQTGSSENSLSYSSDFAISDENVSPKEDSARSQDEESPLDGNKSDFSSIDEMVDVAVLESSESSLERSDNTALPSVTTVKKSLSPSSEADTFESSSTIEEEDELAESEKCDGTNGCFTPPPKANLDETFVINDSSHDEVKSFANPLVVIDTKPDKEFEAVKELIDDLLQTLCEDANQSLCCSMKACRVTSSNELIQKCEKSKPKADRLACLTSVHEEVASKLADDVISCLLRDTAMSVVSVFRELNLFSQLSDLKMAMTAKRQEPDITIPADRNEKNIIESDDSLRPSNEKEISVTNSSSDESIATESPNQSSQSENVSPVHPDWFADDMFLPRSKTPLPPIDQQLLVRQYPYYYRQIPNKPPPPYTPPSSPLPQSIQADAQKESIKAEEKNNPIEVITENLDCEIEDCLTVLLQKKKDGSRLEDVESPYSYTDDTDAVLKHQIIYRKFLFQLTRETVTKLYAEHEGENERKPWLRNQKLASKPVLPLDISKVLPNVLKEIRKLLKLQPQPQKEVSIWSAMKLGRKKRDLVDLLIIEELKDEEADWVNYDEDEFQVKLLLTDSVFDMLKKDTLEVLMEAASKCTKVTT